MKTSLEAPLPTGQKSQIPNGVKFKMGFQNDIWKRTTLLLRCAPRDAGAPGLFLSGAIRLTRACFRLIPTVLSLIQIPQNVLQLLA